MMAAVGFSTLSPMLLPLAMLGMPQAWADMCPGSVEVRGFGTVSLVESGYDLPISESAVVQTLNADSVVPHMNSRTYFADACRVGTYNHSQYTSMKLLDKTFRYTVDLSLAGCGCNAALYLTPLWRNSKPSDCKDYYCDANKVCGVACSEIDIQEANVFGWHTTAHAWDDGMGVGVGLGGNTATWTKEQYGPGAACIDTLRPFEVAASFPAGFDGALRAIGVELSQRSRKGHSCRLSAEVNSYPVKGRDGMAEMSKVLAEGMTPIISYWSSDQMLWLDGEGRRKLTDCKKDSPAACSPQVIFYSFSLEDYQPPTDGCERCPVGSCHRAPTGECHWFDAPYLKGIHSYHCRIDACSQVPQGPGFSTCWSWKGKQFYSVKRRDQPCRTKADLEKPCGLIGDTVVPCKAPRGSGKAEPLPILNQTLDVVDRIMMAEARGPVGARLGGAGLHRTAAILVACLVGALLGASALVVLLRRAGGKASASCKNGGCKHTLLVPATLSAPKDGLRDVI